MGGSPRLLAAGVIIWALAAGVTVRSGALRCHGERPMELQPGLGPMRLMLLRDTIRALTEAQGIMKLASRLSA